MNEHAVAVRPPDNLPAKLTDEAIDRTVENMAQWDKFKARAIGPRDKVQLGATEYIEKSGWVKLSMALNATFEIIGGGQRIPGEDNEGDYYTWKFLGRATLPNGRFIQMDGACSSRDEFFSMRRDTEGAPTRRKASEIDEKDIIATAQTNCFNRCMAFLCGFGEVSADEMKGKQFAGRILTFPFGANKGKQPGDLDAPTLYKELAFWEKQVTDPNNKFAAANAKLVAAIREALAEKTAAVAGAPADPTGFPGRVIPPAEVTAAGMAGGPMSQGTLVTPLDEAWIKVDELLEAKGRKRQWLPTYIKDTWPEVHPPIPKSLGLLQVQALGMYLSTLPDKEGT